MKRWVIEVEGEAEPVEVTNMYHAYRNGVVVETDCSAMAHTLVIAWPKDHFTTIPNEGEGLIHGVC